MNSGAPLGMKLDYGFSSVKLHSQKRTDRYGQESKYGMVGGKGGAAEVPGLPPSTLRSRMKKLGVK